MESSKSSNFVIVLLTVLIVIMIALIGFRYTLISIQVEGSSMEPTYYTGDLLVANRFKAPKREDTVVIDIEESGKWIIKRVIGIEGDTVKIENGKVYRKTASDTDFVMLNEEYVKGSTKVEDGSVSVWELGKDELFFLGDNRENSRDGRYYGVRNKSDVVGVVTEWSVEKSGFWYDFYQVINYPSKLITSLKGSMCD